MGNVGTAQAVLQLNTKGWTGGFSSARGSLSGFSKQVGATALGMIGAGGINQAISTVSRTIKDSIKQYIQFESAMAEVSTLIDTSIVDMSKLEKGVVSLSKKYGEDAEGLANALYQVVSAGVAVEDSLNFLEIATQTAIGGVTDTKTAVDVLTSTMNAYGMQAKDVQEISDSLFTTVKLGKTTMTELAGTIGRVAPMAKAVGLELDEMNNTMAVLTIGMGSTEEAGTALRGMLNAIMKATPVARKEAKRLGIDFSITGLQTKKFAGFLKNLSDKTHGNIESLVKLFPEIRGLNGILQLTSDTGLKRFNKGMEEYAIKVGSSETATSKMANTAGRKLKRLEASVDAAKKSFGEFAITIGGAVVESVIAAKNATIGLILKMEGMSVSFADTLNKENKTLFDWLKIMGQAKTARNKALEQLDTWRGKITLTSSGLKAQVKLYQEWIDKSEKKVEQIGEETKALKEKAKEEKKIADDAAQLKIDAAKFIEEESDRLEKNKEVEKVTAIQKLAMAKLQTQTSIALQSVKVRQFKEQIKMWNFEASNVKNMEAAKLQAVIKSSNIRKELAKEDFEYSIELIGIERVRREQSANGNKKQLEEIKKWYDASLDDLKSKLKEQIRVEIKVTTEAEFKLKQGMMSKLSDEVTLNFKKWGDELKKGSTAAWQGLISDMANVINTVATDFAGLGPEFSKTINGISNIISTALSGNPIATIGAALNLIGSAISETGKKSKEAAEEEHRAAIEARNAAKAFLKAAGKTELSLLSFDGLQVQLLKTEKAQFDLVSKFFTGKKTTTTQLKNIAKGKDDPIVRAQLAKLEAFDVKSRIGGIKLTAGEEVERKVLRKIFGTQVEKYSSKTVDTTLNSYLNTPQFKKFTKEIEKIQNLISIGEPGGLSPEKQITGARTFAEAEAGIARLDISEEARTIRRATESKRFKGEFIPGGARFTDIQKEGNEALNRVAKYQGLQKSLGLFGSNASQIKAAKQIALAGGDAVAVLNIVNDIDAWIAEGMPDLTQLISKYSSKKYNGDSAIDIAATDNTVDGLNSTSQRITASLTKAQQFVSAHDPRLRRLENYLDMQLTLGNLSPEEYNNRMQDIANEYGQLADRVTDPFAKSQFQLRVKNVREKAIKAVNDGEEIDQLIASNLETTTGSFAAGTDIQFQLLKGAIAGPSAAFSQIAQRTADPAPRNDNLNLNVNISSDGNISDQGATDIANAIGEAIVLTNRAQGVT